LRFLPARWRVNPAEFSRKFSGNICCWSTGKLYTQALLGVGINRERKNLSTAAELFSKEAFDGGLRQNTEPWKNLILTNEDLGI